MGYEYLRNLSISNLILIILNDKLDSDLRTYAEFELKIRIKNVSLDYDDFMQLDDDVVKKRGLDVNGYLISPNVNMQQLMETYFEHDYKSEEPYVNGLLLSEKHLCNEIDFNSPFFTRVCNREIMNINQRIDKYSPSSQKDTLLTVRDILIERELRTKNEKKNLLIEALKDSDSLDDLMSYNEVLQRLRQESIYHGFLLNIEDEEEYKMLRTKFGKLKYKVLDALDFIADEGFGELEDVVDSILINSGFINKDSSKLNPQKRQLMKQANSGFVVDYETENIQKVLKNNK